MTRTEYQIRLTYLSKLGFTPSAPPNKPRGHDNTAIEKSSMKKHLHRRVHFDDADVAIIERPACWDYPQQGATSDLWYTLEELQEAADRNVMDFLWDDHPRDDWSTSSHCTYSSPIPAATARPLANSYDPRDIQQLCQINRQLAIRNACLRPPGRLQRACVMWIQHV